MVQLPADPQCSEQYRRRRCSWLECCRHLPFFPNSPKPFLTSAPVCTGPRYRRRAASSTPDAAARPGPSPEPGFWSAGVASSESTAAFQACRLTDICSAQSSTLPRRIPARRAVIGVANIGVAGIAPPAALSRSGFGPSRGVAICAVAMHGLATSSRLCI